MHIESVHENGSVLDVGAQKILIITESPTGKGLTTALKGRDRALTFCFRKGHSTLAMEQPRRTGKQSSRIQLDVRKEGMDQGGWFHQRCWNRKGSDDRRKLCETEDTAK